MLEAAHHAVLSRGCGPGYVQTPSPAMSIGVPSTAAPQRYRVSPADDDPRLGLSCPSVFEIGHVGSDQRALVSVLDWPVLSKQRSTSATLHA